MQILMAPIYMWYCLLFYEFVTHTPLSCLAFVLLPPACKPNLTCEIIDAEELPKPGMHDLCKHEVDQ